MKRFSVSDELYYHASRATRCNTLDGRARYFASIGFLAMEKPKGLGGCELWRNDELNILAKRAFFFAPKDPPRKVRCPTVYLNSTDSDRVWVFQPIVDVRRCAIALKAVKACIPDAGEYDLHAGNCGHYHDVPVCFDW